MPLIETPVARRSSLEESLVADLAQELREPKAVGQPRIEIKHINRRGMKHVHVIWDRWRGCTSSRRAAIVREAFRRERGEEFEQAIAVTVPATVSEAVQLGLLPYQVRPFKRESRSAADESRLHEAMLAEGATNESTDRMPELYFATEDEARAAVHRLRETIPNEEWGMVVSVTGAA